jgi:pyruvate formate lyase activating enzyme
VRVNEGGELRVLNRGFAESLGLDPVEKKPLYHYLPGTLTFSVGAPGCNFDCLGCQNHTLSRPDPGWPGVARPVPPELLAEKALETGARSFSFTYSEPTVFYEYARDLGLLALEAGLPSIWVTNGFMSPETLKSLDWVKAMNVDLKGFTEDFYESVTGGRLEPVKENIRNSREMGIHVEVTTLLIPELNTGERELNGLTEFLADVSPDMPWHVSLFRPMREQRHLRTTSREELLFARSVGKKNGLKHVYIGNIEGRGYGDTFCPKCGTLLVGRSGFFVRENVMGKDGLCPECATPIPGVWGP